MHSFNWYFSSHKSAPSCLDYRSVVSVKHTEGVKICQPLGKAMKWLVVFCGVHISQKNQSPQLITQRLKNNQCLKLPTSERFFQPKSSRYAGANG